MSSLGATDGGAELQLRQKGAMDNYLIGNGGTKSYSGSSTGATEGAAYIQLTTRGPMDKYMIGPYQSNSIDEYLHKAGAEFSTFNLHKLRVYNNYY